MVHFAAWPARRWIALGLDAVVVFAAYLVALLLRFDGAVPAVYWSNFVTMIPLVVAAFIAVNLVAGAYTSPAVGRSVASGLATGVGVALVVIFLGSALRPLPMSVLFLGAVGSLAGFVASRLVLRP